MGGGTDPSMLLVGQLLVFGAESMHKRRRGRRDSERHVMHAFFPCRYCALSGGSKNLVLFQFASMYKIQIQDR